MANILVIGDSHSRYFKDISDGIQCKVITVVGATAQGAVNPNSKTHALSHFTEALKSSEKYEYICVMLGEVDCGFLIWYRAEKHNISIEEQLDISIKNYEDFLTKVVRQYYQSQRIIIVSPPLPTIKDNADPKFLQGARAQVKATQKERTELTLEYNKRLQKMCKENNFVWMDVTSMLMNQQTGLIDDRFKHSNDHDHHLNQIEATKIYQNELMKIIKEEESG